MNLSKSSLRRTSALVAGALIGLTGAFTFAAPASAHNTDLTGEASCTKDGGWQVNWKLTTSLSAQSPSTLATVVATQGTTDYKVFVKGTRVDPDGSISETMTYDKSVEKAGIFTKILWDDEHQARADKEVDRPEGCKPETPPTTPPGDLTDSVAQDCTTITITIDNTAGVPVELKYKTSKGEERANALKPGEKKAEKFSATPGFTVTVTASAKGEEDISKTYTYTKPDDCDGGAGGNGGGLPVTGAAAGTIAGGAALLLVVGGLLFVMARRRKVKFTA